MMALSMSVLRLLFTVATVSLLAVLLLGVITHRRPRPVVGPVVRTWTIVGAVTVAGAVVASRLVQVLPWDAGWVSDRILHYALPTGAGVVAVAVLMLPSRRWQPAGAAVLSRRTLSSFAERWWLATPLVVAAVIVVVSVLAGQASIPDEQGHHRLYRVEFGPNTIGTEIYGWYYSGPSMVVLGLLLLVTLVALKLVARPALADDGADAATRRWRSRNIVALSTGAMLLHLFMVLASLVGTSSMHGGAVTGGEWFTAQPPLVILRTPMLVSAVVVEFVGWFLCFAVLLAALRPAKASNSEQAWQSASR